jgi:hypothetical protein
VVFACYDRAIALSYGMFKMALETEIGVTLDEHLLIHRTMWIVTSRAAFAHRVVLKNKWAFLGGVALGAGLSLVLETRAAALDGIAFVGVVTFGAAHFAGHHGMAVWEAEFAAFIEVAMEAGFGRLARIHDGAFASTRLDVFAAGAVAAFTAGAFGVFALNDEFGVCGVIKALYGFLVALRTFF